MAYNDITTHFATERSERDNFIDGVIGRGNVVESFVVDRGHVGGAEVHDVTDTGVVVVRNQQTGRIITELIARPAQLRRLYDGVGQAPPKWLLKKAYDNNRRGYNTK